MLEWRCGGSFFYHENIPDPQKLKKIPYKQVGELVIMND